jgi:hypothetical protein
LSELRREWIASLDELFEDVCAWLEPPRNMGLLDVEIVRVLVSEPELGTYDAPSLRIRTSWQEIDVRPISRVVLGGSGRADIGFGPRRMIIMRCPDKSQWLISSADPKDEGQPLSEESFARALQCLLELSGILAAHEPRCSDLV